MYEWKIGLRTKLKVINIIGLAYFVGIKQISKLYKRGSSLLILKIYKSYIDTSVGENGELNMYFQGYH